jgi:tetratricopeptide (TPR) repeat protein
MLVAESMKTYRKGIELLNSERLAVRFPHMLALINNAVELLSSPDKVYAQTIEANKEQRYFEAIEYALFGLSRHPKNQLLWRAYFTAKTELIKSGRSATAEEMESLLTELSSVNANGLLSDFETTYLTATILEALGRYVEAQTQYLDAVGLAGNNTRNKIQAQANAARLRAANATAHKKPL